MPGGDPANPGAAEVAAAVGRREQPQEGGAAWGLHQDRLHPAVGGVGAGVDLESEAEVGKVGEEELRPRAGGELLPVEARPDAVRLVVPNRPGQSPRTLAQVGGVIRVVPRPRLRLEAGTHALERVDRSRGRLDAHGVERSGRRTGGHGQGRGPVGGDSEGAGDVVGAPLWYQRQLGKTIQGSVRRSVQGAIAADEHHSPTRRFRASKRIEQLGFARGHDGVAGSAEFLEDRRQLGSRPPRIVDPARMPVHREQQASLGSVRRTLFSALIEFDERLVDAATALEHPVLTAMFVLLSAWWVKGPLLVALGLGCDLWRRRAPLAFLAAGAAVLSASLLVTPLKDLFGRDRPPEADPELGTVVATPDNASFPSGHSATAFAAATAIAILSPRMRPYALGLAAAVALSRIYLRVHFPLDVLAGALLGAALGAVAALTALRLARPGEPRAA